MQEKQQKFQEERKNRKVVMCSVVVVVVIYIFCEFDGAAAVNCELLTISRMPFELLFKLLANIWIVLFRWPYPNILESLN